VERGQDPRLFTLVSFGGAGGLHVCELAASLRVPRVIVPRSPGTLSALGVLLGDVVKDYARTVMLRSLGLKIRALERGFEELEREAVGDLKNEGFDKASLKLARSVAMRYVGQSFEIDIPWNKRFESAFHAAHLERYGYSDSSRPVEIVSLRLRAAGITHKPGIKSERDSKAHRPEPARFERVYWSERAARGPVYAREDLRAGARFKGPAIITEYSSTTLIPPRCSVEVDRWANLLIDIA
jgi:N-methylhydantoinase A